jgi:tetratricopeptide (TPR) repeat protein
MILLFLSFFFTQTSSASIFTVPVSIRTFVGDSKFWHRRDQASAHEALRIYRRIYKLNPDDFEAAWRVSMICYYIGIRFTEKDQKAKLYEEGRDAGKRAYALNDQCAPCHFWFAINSALYAESVGVIKMLFTLSDIRKHLARSIEVDPFYAYAGAYRLQGLIEQKLPGVLGGSNSRSKEYFQKAIEHAPDEPMNYLYLARLLKSEFEDVSGALTVARQGLKEFIPSYDRVEATDALEDLKKFINETMLN